MKDLGENSQKLVRNLGKLQKFSVKFKQKEPHLITYKKNNNI